MIYSFNKFLGVFVKEWSSEFHVQILTKTMLKKSVIDLNKEIALLWKNKRVIDIDILDRDDKQIVPLILSSDKGTKKGRMSIYRPKGAKPGKRGDPRFWPYGLNKVANSEDKLVIFVINNVVILIIVDLDNVQDPKKIINEINTLLY